MNIETSDVRKLSRNVDGCGRIKFFAGRSFPPLLPCRSVVMVAVQSRRDKALTCTNDIPVEDECPRSARGDCRKPKCILLGPEMD